MSDDQGEAASEDQGAPRPLRSVREVMGEVKAEPDTLEMEDREITVGERRWRVEVIGATRSGGRGDAGAPLLLVRFTEVAGGDDDQEPPEAWVVGEDLERVSDAELEELLIRAQG